MPANLLAAGPWQLAFISGFGTMQASGQEQLDACRRQVDDFFAAAGFSQAPAVVPSSVALAPKTNSTINAVNSRTCIGSVR